MGSYLCRMKTNMGRIMRYLLIITRLSGLQKYVPADELVDYINARIKDLGYPAGLTLRTIQRDFKDIAEIFEVKIKNRRYYGYHIAETVDNPVCDYHTLLLNFDLLTSVNSDSRISEYLLAEHHRPKGSANMPLLISAIKDSNVLTFDYTNVRNDDSVSHKTVKPHFLKESLGLWYLLGIDRKDGRLKVFGIDRISNLEVSDETFVRDRSINPSELFRNSYGIWDDPRVPVEKVVLSFSGTDRKFVKIMPLHHTQTILVDNDDELRVSVEVRVTNDFVMALLSRSKTLVVIEPQSLRQRIAEIYRDALERNS